MNIYINDHYNFYYDGDVITGKLISNEKGIYSFETNELKIITLPNTTKLFPSTLNNFIYEELITFKNKKIDAIISKKELLDTYNKIDNNYCLIHISEPFEDFEELNYFKNELYTSFYSYGSKIKECKPISKDELDSIINFYNECKTKIIIVCDTGKIKGATLAYFLTKNDEIFDFDRYLVSQDLLDSFENHYKKEEVKKRTSVSEEFKREYDEYITA